MKKVKCLVLKSFKDAEDNDREVKSNSEYICSEERANKLSLLRYVKILEDVSSDDVAESTSNNNDYDNSSSDVDKEPSTNDNDESDLETGKESTEDNEDESSSDNKELATENDKIETATLIDKTKIKNAKK